MIVEAKVGCLSRAVAVWDVRFGGGDVGKLRLSSDLSFTSIGVCKQKNRLLVLELRNWYLLDVQRGRGRQSRSRWKRGGGVVKFVERTHNHDGGLHDGRCCCGRLWERRKKRKSTKDGFGENKEAEDQDSRGIGDGGGAKENGSLWRKVLEGLPGMDLLERGRTHTQSARAHTKAKRCLVGSVAPPFALLTVL